MHGAIKIILRPWTTWWWSLHIRVALSELIYLPCTSPIVLQSTTVTKEFPRNWQHSILFRSKYLDWILLTILSNSLSSLLLIITSWSITVASTSAETVARTTGALIDVATNFIVVFVLVFWSIWLISIVSQHSIFVEYRFMVHGPNVFIISNSPIIPPPLTKFGLSFLLTPRACNSFKCVECYRKYNCTP